MSSALTFFRGFVLIMMGRPTCSRHTTLDDEWNVGSSTIVIVDSAETIGRARVVLARCHDFGHVSLVDVLSVGSSLETGHRRNVRVASNDLYLQAKTIMFPSGKDKVR